MIGQGSGNASLKASIACPSEQELLDSLEGHIAMSDEASVVEHLDRCGACRDRLQKLAASNALGRGGRPVARQRGRRIPRAQNVKALLQTQIARADETLPPIKPDLSLDFLTPCLTPGRLGCMGPYEIIQVLGQGGMGLVLKALDPALDRVVAIKVLDSSLALSPEVRARFRREARSAAVHSEHAVAIHGVEETAQPPYLVMEYVAGESLQQRID